MKNTLSQYLIIYRRKDGGGDLWEVTSDVNRTVAMLESQGFIIVDIIDIGRMGG